MSEPGSFKTDLLAAIPSLRAFAMSLAQNSDKADDLVQETLARALSRIEQWQTGESPRKWLFSILHNLHTSSIHAIPSTYKAHTLSSQILPA